MGGLGKPMGCLLVVALVLLVSSSTVQSSWPMMTWRVDVLNGLSGGQALFVHCQSKDDDLGEHTLPTAGDFNWTFKDNVWKTTLFWCYLRKPNNVNVSFDAYWVDESSDEWFYKSCDYKNCIWTAADAGIYLKNISEDKDYLIHTWPIA